uniref:Uncharacterized protein n=1 Tax=Anguilla anguilla TaxID=7936 RepID=A0A0E9W877_ANGAN
MREMCCFSVYHNDLYIFISLFLSLLLSPSPKNRAPSSKWCVDT